MIFPKKNFFVTRYFRKEFFGGKTFLSRGNQNGPRLHYCLINLQSFRSFRAAAGFGGRQIMDDIFPLFRSEPLLFYATKSEKKADQKKGWSKKIKGRLRNRKTRLRRKKRKESFLSDSIG